MTDLRERVARVLTGKRYGTELGWEDRLKEADAVIAAILPPGWRVVPEEPTEEMQRASRLTQQFPEGAKIARVHMWGSNAWAAMLAAAPNPPAAIEEKYDG